MKRKNQQGCKCCELGACCNRKIEKLVVRYGLSINGVPTGTPTEVEFSINKTMSEMYCETTFIIGKGGPILDRLITDYKLTITGPAQVTFPSPEYRLDPDVCPWFNSYGTSYSTVSYSHSVSGTHTNEFYWIDERLVGQPLVFKIGSTYYCPEYSNPATDSAVIAAIEAALPPGYTATIDRVERDVVVLDSHFTGKNCTIDSGACAATDVYNYYNNTDYSILVTLKWGTILYSGYEVPLMNGIDLLASVWRQEIHSYNTVQAQVGYYSCIDTPLEVITRTAVPIPMVRWAYHYPTDGISARGSITANCCELWPNAVQSADKPRETLLPYLHPHCPEGDSWFIGDIVNTYACPVVDTQDKTPYIYAYIVYAEEPEALCCEQEPITFSKFTLTIDGTDFIMDRTLLQDELGLLMTSISLFSQLTPCNNASQDFWRGTTVLRAIFTPKTDPPILYIVPDDVTTTPRDLNDSSVAYNPVIIPPNPNIQYIPYNVYVRTDEFEFESRKNAVWDGQAIVEIKVESGITYMRVSPGTCSFTLTGTYLGKMEAFQKQAGAGDLRYTGSGWCDKFPYVFKLFRLADLGFSDWVPFDYSTHSKTITVPDVPSLVTDTGWGPLQTTTFNSHQIQWWHEPPKVVPVTGTTRSLTWSYKFDS